MDKSVFINKIRPIENPIGVKNSSNMDSHAHKTYVFNFSFIILHLMKIMGHTSIILIQSIVSSISNPLNVHILM